MEYLGFKEIQRGDSLDELEKGLRNKFKWEWLTREDQNRDYFSLYTRKITKAGRKATIHILSYL